MDLPTIISRTCTFLILRELEGIYHFYQNFNRKFCKQTVETLIRRRVLQRLIWVCTVCLCPTKRMLGLYGLITNYGDPDEMQQIAGINVYNDVKVVVGSKLGSIAYLYYI